MKTHTQILELIKKLVSIPSTFDNKHALENILDLALSELKGFTIEKFTSEGITSALIYNREKRPEKFTILLNGHLDIIPGKPDQNQAKTIGNRLSGNGVLDMKAGAACLILVFREIANRVSFPLALQLTTDEEIGGFNGTKHQIAKGVKADFVITGEPTNLNIANSAKGVLNVKITCKGKTAHGAYTWRGENAIFKMNEFLHTLEESFPTPPKESWITTVNVSNIETTNQSFNKIPDDCTIWLDIRFVPEDAKTILTTIKKILPKGFIIEILVNEPYSQVHENNPFIKKLQEAVRVSTHKNAKLYGAHGSSDVRHFSNVGSSGVEFGPVGGDIGSDEEWVSIPSLELYKQVLKHFLLNSH